MILRQFVNRLFRLEPGEGPKLLQFGLFGFLLQTGMGIGFSAGDAAFLSNVGASSLPVIFLLTPVVMLLYTAVFSYLMVRFAIGFIVNFTLALLIAGGAVFWALIDIGLPPEWQSTVYFALKLYLAVWYIGLYTLFWNFTDTYFDIQDAKRLFPLFAAFCASGTATGALLVSFLAGTVPMHYLFLLWSVIAFATAPVARFLQHKWTQIAESDILFDETSNDHSGNTFSKFANIGRAFIASRFAMMMALTLFVTLLMTNLAEFQYSMILQEGRSEAELAALLGALYAGANLFNMLVCLLVFNRLVARIGVRNVALIQPLTYFAVFGFFFLEGGTAAALAAFFAYHGVLTSIQYNNENLLFNGLPSQVKRPLRTVIEGLCEPLASLAVGGFLLYWADVLDIRELSGVGVIISFCLIAVVFGLRGQYPGAMAANMQRGWLNFGRLGSAALQFSSRALQRLERAAEDERSPAGLAANRLLLAQYKAAQFETDGADTESAVADLSGRAEERARGLETLSKTAGPQHFYLFPQIAQTLPELSPEDRHRVIGIIGQIGDTEMIPDILAMAAELAPRDRRAVAEILEGMGETAIPQLASAIGIHGGGAQTYRFRLLAARALAQLSYAQYSSQLDRLVQSELHNTGRLLQSARLLEGQSDPSGTLSLIARAQRERTEASVDFALELLSLGQRLPDADLLIVSLHSSNTKVRGNAIEAIENGVDRPTFRLLRPLLQNSKEQRIAGIEAGAEEALQAALRHALQERRPIEAAGAIRALSQRIAHQELAQLLQPLLVPNMHPIIRDAIGDVFKVQEHGKLSLLDILTALSASASLGAAPLQSLLALAEKAQFEKPGRPAIREDFEQTPIWFLESDLHAIAARFPALALVLLKSQTGARNAA